MSNVSIRFECTPEQLKTACKKTFGIEVALPSPSRGNYDIVQGLINALLGVIDANEADPNKTRVHGATGMETPGSWGITIYAKGQNGQSLGEEIARLQTLLGIL
jgi:hypothetical protein